MLEARSYSIGDFHRCPNSRGMFISQELLAAAGQDRAQTLAAFEETKSLLLPTEKWCPQCQQKLFDGRVRSRGVILTLYPVCQKVWTSLALLRQFDEAIEKTISL